MSRLFPCVCTWAPVLPEALTRDKMIVSASARSVADGVPPLRVVACMVS